MGDEKKLQIHNILYKYCSDFLNVQEITHAANEIVKDPTEATIQAMIDYLDSYDTMRNGSQSILQPTNNVKAFTANNVRFAMSEIRKLIGNNVLSVDDSLFKSVVKAPLHDVSETYQDNELVTGYSVTVGTIEDNETYKIVPLTFAGTGLKKHTNGAGTNAYWMGMAVSDSILVSGATVKFTRGFGQYDNTASYEWTDLASEYFEEDANIASSGRYCSFYREVGEAKQNDGHAFVAFKVTKDDKVIVYVYDYNYTGVSLAE